MIAVRRRTPLPVLALAVIGGALVVLPVVALVIRAPWGRFIETLSGEGARTALRLSLEVSLAATVLSLLFGVPLAWVLARTRFRGCCRRWWRASGCSRRWDAAAWLAAGSSA
jgi:molybdate transport system permease protein